SLTTVILGYMRGYTVGDWNGAILGNSQEVGGMGQLIFELWVEFSDFVCDDAADSLNAAERPEDGETAALLRTALASEDGRRIESRVLFSELHWKGNAGIAKVGVDCVTAHESEQTLNVGWTLLVVGVHGELGACVRNGDNG
ncbi:hypothetical protein PFISCL1PPCAC_26408, partial [Pristionchus fissidentatus]